MPFQDRLDADRFFARILSLDISCPHCGTVHKCNGITGPFRRRTGRFQCPDCGKVLALAVLAYSVTTKPGTGHIAQDQIPNAREAMALRQANPGMFAAQTLDPTAPRNVVLRDPCRCILEGTALIVHPHCPIHSSLTLTRGRRTWNNGKDKADDGTPPNTPV